MKKTILEIYALAVCFATIVCATTALGFALWDVVQIAKPDFTVNGYVYEQHQDNESFRPYNDCSKSADDPAAEAARAAADAAAAAADGEAAAGAKCRKYTAAELTAKREASWAKALRAEQREGFQSLLRCLIVILLDILVFIPHWIIARRARQSTT